MKVCLITWKVPQCLSPCWVQQVQNETVILSLHPSLPFPFISPCACLHLQTMTRLIFRLPPAASPPLLTAPHKQGHSAGCKRKMYHLLGDRWQDVSAKSFYFDQQYCNPAAPVPLLSNWARRQKATATLAAEEIASSVWWKIHKLLLKNECICSTTWPNMKTNWTQLFLVITYLATGAEIHRLYPLAGKVHIWHYYTSYQFKRSFTQRGFHYCPTALSARPEKFPVEFTAEKGSQWCNSSVLFYISFNVSNAAQPKEMQLAACSVSLAKDGNDMSGWSKHLKTEWEYSRTNQRLQKGAWLNHLRQ